MTSSNTPPRLREQRHPPRDLPGAPQHQDVEVAVVVVVGVAGVEREDLVGQAGRVRDVLERAVAAVAQQEGPALGVGGGHEDVEPAVAVEVVDQAAAGHRLAPRVEPDRETPRSTIRPALSPAAANRPRGRRNSGGPRPGIRPGSCRRRSGATGRPGPRAAAGGTG